MTCGSLLYRSVVVFCCSALLWWGDFIWQLQAHHVAIECTYCDCMQHKLQRLATTAPGQYLIGVSSGCTGHVWHGMTSWFSIVLGTKAGSQPGRFACLKDAPLHHPPAPPAHAPTQPLPCHNSACVLNYVEAKCCWCSQVMLGVDRLDMIKGIPQKLLAFEEFLEEHPEWRDKVLLVQIAVPSRTDVPEYQVTCHHCCMQVKPHRCMQVKPSLLHASEAIIAACK